MTTSTLVDSNIFLDLLQGGAAAAWSREMLARVGGRTILAVNPIIWSEISARFESEFGLLSVLAGLSLQRQPLSFDAAFVAGKAHSAYRLSGGARERTLSDFLVGAHAVVNGQALLTRDPRRYRTYFPALEIIAPDTHP